MTVKGVLLDIAGVLCDGDKVIPGALEAIAELRVEGLPSRLVTNTTRRPKYVLVDQLLRLGFDVAPYDVFTGTEALVAHLRARRLTPDLGTAPDETVMIGDDVEADVNGALAVGLQTVLVRTGKYRAGDELLMNEGGESAADVRDAVAMVLSR